MLDALKKIAKATGLEFEALEENFNNSVKATEDYISKSPMQSAGGKPSPEENALFDIISKTGYKPQNKFTMQSLMDLFTNVEAMYSKFFPLRDGTTGRIITPSIHLVPSVFPHPKWMDTVDTAAASKEGDIVFNKDFAETLMAYADLFDIKGNAKFYVSNGGDIPDNYIFIEFLIQHEIGHILRGDAGIYIDALTENIRQNKEKYKKILKMFGNNPQAAAGHINNVAADLIMNHSIVKSGLPMLPIGLLSSEINYDKIKNISEMWDIIADEMENNFDEDAFDKQQEQMDDHQQQEGDSSSDDTKGTPGGGSGGGQDEEQDSENKDGDNEDADQDKEDDDNNTKGTPGGKSNSKSKGSQKGNQDGDQKGSSQDGDQDGDNEDGSQDGENEDGSQDGDQDGDSKDGDSKDSDQDGSKDGDNGKDSSQSQSDAVKKAEEAFKDAQQKIKESNSNRDKSEEELKKMAKEAEDAINKQSKEDLKKKIEDLMNRTKVSDSNTIGAEDYEPRYDWKRIVKRMMPTSESIDTSYSKINRRNAAGLLQMKEQGISAAKAGEIIEQGDKKDVVFVLDRSGSVSSVLAKVKKEMKKLIDKHSDGIDNFYVIKFDSGFDVYKISDNRKTFTRYKTKEYLKDSAEPTGSTYPIHKLFVEETGGGTEFHKEIIKFMDNILSNGGSAILFTDSDILWDKNKKNIAKLIRSYGKRPFKFNIVLASKDDFTRFIKEITAYTYLTYFRLD